MGDCARRGQTRAGKQFAAPEKAPEYAEALGQGAHRRIAAIRFHAWQKAETEERENEVGGPHADEGWNSALSREARAHNEEGIIGTDHENGEECAGSASTAARLRTERNGDKSKDKTSDGKGEALVEFDASIAPIFAPVVMELGERALRIADFAFFGGIQAGEFDGPIAATEGGDGIVIWIFTRELVGGTTIEMELQLALPGLGNYNRTFRKSDLVSGLSASFSEKDAVPARAAGGDVVNVEDHVREALIEDAGLDEEGDLGADEATFDVAEGAKRERGKPEGHEEGKGSAEDGKDADGEEDTFAADAEGGDGDDFAVHGHAAKTEENAHEDGHGDGEDEQTGDEAEEELEDLRPGTGVTNN